jgi:hypothetical protein
MGVPPSSSPSPLFVSFAIYVFSHPCS